MRKLTELSNEISRVSLVEIPLPFGRKFEVHESSFMASHQQNFIAINF